MNFRIEAGMSDESLLARAAVVRCDDEYRIEGGVDEYKGTWHTDIEEILVYADVLANSELCALGTVKLDDVLFDEPIFGDNVVQQLSNRVSYSYEISDRIDWINNWDLAFQQADDDETRFTTNTLTTSFAYHLTNRLDLGLTLAALDTDDQPNLDQRSKPYGYTISTYTY